MLSAVELFTGAGGLSMGLSLAGFNAKAVVERDKWACGTIRKNQACKNKLVEGWPLFEGDIRDFDFSSIPAGIDLIAGGPPCQPFSLGGKHSASLDERDMFPHMIEAIRQVKPRAFIIENVKGLTRKAFSEYFQYIVLQLEFPDVVKRKSEGWLDHLARLERAKTSGRKSSKTYEVVYRVLNSADYGVPQKRERVFIVGFRHDLHVEWSFPKPTHSYDALLYSQWVSGDYWREHRIAKKDIPIMDSKLASRVKKLHESQPKDARWQTVRDAIRSLPDPTKRTSKKFSDHIYQPGAKVYPGHTGSPIDLPSKTLKAGVHGVPGGENMVVLPSGEVRYFTIRESARIQTFPDSYKFGGAWTEVMRQLGNAVPVKLGKVIASSVAETLLLGEEQQLRKAALKGIQ